MVRNYKPATFQPTVRQSWAGTLSYLSNEEKAKIFEAIVKYPSIDLDSPFWRETVKPDLDLQHEKFISSCKAKGIASKSFWDERGKICYPSGEHMVTSIKEKEKVKEEVKEKREGFIRKSIYSPIRPDFRPSNQTVKILMEKMLDPKLCLDFFIRECLANDYRYANYDAKMANFDYPDSCRAYNPRL